jgi:hypothetical protein
MSPAEDALLLLRLAERHLGSLRGTLDPGRNPGRRSRITGTR